ncbi:MAG: hypothetical protein AB1793_04055 [Candidatus Thermoplasmatota archaeon]
MSAALCESNESRLANAPRAGGPALFALGFSIVFFGVLSGMCMLHFEEELLGTAILAGTAASVALMVAYGLRMNRAGS